MISRPILVFSTMLLLLLHGQMAADTETATVKSAVVDNAQDFSPVDFDEAMKPIAHLIGPDDALLVADPDGTILFSRHADTPRIPASTLKVLTSLAALHYMGEEYRFQTHFFIDDSNNLTIKGFGDPLLISEEIDAICGEIKRRLRKRESNRRPGQGGSETPDPSREKWINDLVLDDAYVRQPIRIPGRDLSLEPYDAPNGALSVNFNTVFFKASGNRIVSAEPQTPLLPLAMDKIKSSGLRQGRITLTHKQGEVLQYAGEMFRHFLEKHGIKIKGAIRTGSPEADKGELLMAHASSHSLEMVIAMLLKYSNNFIANQLVLALGAEIEGTPATLEKGVTAVTRYAYREIGISDFRMVEGSGLSRENRLTARQMSMVLDAFAPYYELMPHKGRQYFKTGTLTGISTRVGYVTGIETGRRYRFVVFLNGRGKSSEKVARMIESALAK